MPILWDKYVILSLTFLQYTFHDKFLQLKKRERERIGAQTFQGPKIHITKFSMVIYKIKKKKKISRVVVASLVSFTIWTSFVDMAWPWLGAHEMDKDIFFFFFFFTEYG